MIEHRLLVNSSIRASLSTTLSFCPSYSSNSHYDLILNDKIRNNSLYFCYFRLENEK